MGWQFGLFGTAGRMDSDEAMSKKRHNLTIQEVAQIRQQYAAGRRPKLIAEQFKVCRLTVWRIAHGCRGEKQSNKT